jgi:hypothetical protein
MLGPPDYILRFSSSSTYIYGETLEESKIRLEGEKMKTTALSNDEKWKIAREVRDAFVQGFQSRFKYIENLKYTEIYEDTSFCKIQKAGWYGWLIIENDPGKHNFKSYYIGYSYDMDKEINAEDMKEIAKMAKKWDDDIRAGVDKLYRENVFEKSTITFNYTVNSDSLYKDNFPIEEVKNCFQNIDGSTIVRDSPAKCTCDLNVIVNTGCKCGGI